MKPLVKFTIVALTVIVCSTFSSAQAQSVGSCKDRSPNLISVSLPKDDWSLSLGKGITSFGALGIATLLEHVSRLETQCQNNCNGVILRVKNSSSDIIESITMRGVQTKHRASTNNALRSGAYQEYFFPWPSNLLRVDKNFYVDFEKKGECQDRFTQEDIDRGIKKETIFENCVIDKSKEASKFAMPEIRSLCRRISEDPRQDELKRYSR